MTHELSSHRDGRYATNILHYPGCAIMKSGNCFSGKAINKQIMLYDVMYSGQPCAYIERQPGTLEITLPAATINGKLRVLKRSRS